MGLLDGFEKLINEHGSAVILKERIALANDKHSALEQKLSASESRAKTASLRVKDLVSENNALRLNNDKLKKQVLDLQESLVQFHIDNLTLKYGIYWDKNGNPFCPKCKTPTTNIAWATYTNRQIHGLKCSCSDKPFILMENGEPIHAQDAMKLMTNA